MCRLNSGTFFIYLLLIGIFIFFQFKSASAQIKPERVYSIIELDSLVREFRVKDNFKAKQYAATALRNAMLEKNPKDICLALFLNGTALSSVASDSGFYYFNKALHLADSAGYSEIKVRIMFGQANLFQEASDFKSALLILDSCYKIAERENIKSWLVRSLNSMGNLYIELGDSSMSKKMYQEAYKLALDNGSLTEQGIELGNLANFESDQANKIKMILKALELLGHSRGFEEETAQFMINAGAFSPDPNEAMEFYKKALNVATKANLQITKIAALNNLAYSYLDLGLNEQAEACLRDQAIPIAQGLNNSDWLSTLYDSYADVLKAKNEYKKALEFEKLSVAERQNADQLKSSKQVRLLAAIMDTKNKENIILKNQQSIDSQKLLIKKQFMGLILAGLVSIAVVFLLIIFILRMRLRMKIREIATARQLLDIEENEKTALSRELHDTVSNLVEKLNGYISSLSIGNDEIQGEIGNRLMELSTGIRRISHRIQRLDFKENLFSDLISELCFDMENMTTLSVNVRISDEFLQPDEAVARSVYRMVEEMLNNASKHARNSNVLISIETKEKFLVLTYEDDGPGFSLEKDANRGIGIRNIMERARLTGGKAVCTTSPGNGTDWKVKIPMN